MHSPWLMKKYAVRWFLIKNPSIETRILSFVSTQSLFSRDDGALIRDYMTRPKENESPSSDFHARLSPHLEDPRWFLIHFAYRNL